MVKRFSRTEASTRGSGSSRRDEQGAPPDVAGQVHFLGDRHLRESPQEVLIRRPPDGRDARGRPPTSAPDHARRASRRARARRSAEFEDARRAPSGRRGASARRGRRGSPGEFRRRGWPAAGASGTPLRFSCARAVPPATGAPRGSARATRPPATASLAAGAAPRPRRAPSPRRRRRRAARPGARRRGVEMPNPIAIGRVAGGPARPRDGAREVAREARPARPWFPAGRRRRETRSTTARLRASVAAGDVGDARKTVSSPARRKAATNGGASSGGTSVRSTPSNPAAAARRAASATPQPVHRVDVGEEDQGQARLAADPLRDRRRRSRASSRTRGRGRRRAGGPARRRSDPRRERPARGRRRPARSRALREVDRGVRPTGSPAVRYAMKAARPSARARSNACPSRLTVPAAQPQDFVEVLVSPAGEVDQDPAGARPLAGQARGERDGVRGLEGGKDALGLAEQARRRRALRRPTPSCTSRARRRGGRRARGPTAG